MRRIAKRCLALALASAAVLIPAANAAGNGQLLLCWSIAFEIASRFLASADGTPRF